MRHLIILIPNHCLSIYFGHFLRFRLEKMSKRIQHIWIKILVLIGSDSFNAVGRVRKHLFNLM